MSNMKMSRLPRTSHILFVALFIIAIMSGCSREDRSIVNAPDTLRPAITAAITPESLPVEPGGQITLNIASEMGNDLIAGMKYSITGMVSQDGSLEYAQPLNSVSENISLQIPLDATPDSSFTLTVQVRDISGNIHCIIREFYPLDNQPPQLALTYDGTRDYVPNDTIMVQVTATDNTALDYIAFSTGGAFAWDDTLDLSGSYPAEVDTQIAIPVKDTAYFGLELWITAEAVDANFNSGTYSSPESITLLDTLGPRVIFRPVVYDSIVRPGDTLSFWVIAIDNQPLSGIYYAFGWDNYFIRDSVVRPDFAAIDSAHFSVTIPEDIFSGIDCNCSVLASVGARDIHGYWGRNYMGEYPFRVEGRIRLSQSSKAYHSGWICVPILDEIRGLIYIGEFNGRVNIYSIAMREYIDYFILPVEEPWLHISHDGNKLLAKYEQMITICDLTVYPPEPDTTIHWDAFAGPSPEWSGLLILPDNKVLIFPDTIYDHAEKILQLDLSDYSFSIPVWAKPEMTNIWKWAVSRNNRYIILEGYDSFWLVDLTTATSIKSDDYLLSLSMAVSYDGSRIVIFGPDKIRILNGNLEILQEIEVDRVSYGFIEFCTFSEDDRHIYTMNSDYIGIFDIETAQFEECTRPRTESYYPIVLAGSVNQEENRMFITSQSAGPADMSCLFDIPIEPGD